MNKEQVLKQIENYENQIKQIKNEIYNAEVKYSEGRIAHKDKDIERIDKINEVEKEYEKLLTEIAYSVLEAENTIEKGKDEISRLTQQINKCKIELQVWDRVEERKRDPDKYLFEIEMERMKQEMA